MHIIYLILYQPLFNALIFLYNTIAFHDLGIAIVILTIIIRLILWPSQSKALRSQRDLQKLQPELQKIQSRYKDKQKQTEAMLQFYKTHKVSPFSSCLPTLIQFPIIIALYTVFRNSLNQSSLDALYSFISRPEQINAVSLGFLNLSQPEKIFLPIITGGLQFIQSWMMLRRTAPSKSGDPTAMMTRQMMYVFPVMTVLIAMTLPAALPVYWIVTTLFAIVQQWYIFREGDKLGTSIVKTAKKIRVKVKRKKS